MIELHQVHKIYQDGLRENHILHNINLQIKEGEFLTIMGPSGCGKSTLLNILSLLTKPTQGEVFLNGEKVNYAKEKDLDNLRRNHIGLVFQNANLISCLNPIENILLTMNGKDRYTEKKKRVLELLELVGLSDKYKSNIRTLSGGEVQRISIVRALINRPELLLCDEPTGALDSGSAENIMKVLKDLQKETKCSLVIVTHDENIGKLGTRRILIKGGTICEMETNTQPL